jgi:two-component system, NtrC family, sensor kinase
MGGDTRLEDLIGIEHTKLGFFKEAQIKMRELRLSNRELEQKRQEIQAILDGITDVMAVVRPDFRMVSVNHVFFKTFSCANPLDRRCYEVFRGRSRPCAPCPLTDALRANHVCRQTHIFDVDGKNRQFEITASPLMEAGGTAGNVLLLKRDVTVEKAYEAKYYHAEKMATIGLLAAGIAHEINNPLTAIGGFAEGLRRRLPRLREGMEAAEPRFVRVFEEYLETIGNECNRCRDIVRNLLTFSPRERVAFTQVSVNRIVVDVIKLLEHQLRHRLPRAICLGLDPSEPEAIGVEAELKQVVLNLVLNALDAVRGDGQITVRSGIDGQWTVLTVEDTGCGIPADHLGKLFDPFFTTKPVGQGIGVGLSTCYNIIRQHKGEILVDSEPGIGSTFRVNLPRP